MSLVCLDTNVIQWGLLRRASGPDRQQLVARSVELVEHLNSNGAQIVLPTVVMAELLVPVRMEEQEAVLDRFDERWIVADFDPRAAMKYAEIRSRMKDLRDQEIEREGRSSTARCVLSPDAMIIATAIVNKAEVIYTGDSDFARRTHEFMRAEYLFDLDLPPKQVGLDLPDPDPA